MKINNYQFAFSSNTPKVNWYGASDYYGYMSNKMSSYSAFDFGLVFLIRGEWSSVGDG